MVQSRGPNSADYHECDYHEPSLCVDAYPAEKIYFEKLLPRLRVYLSRRSLPNVGRSTPLLGIPRCYERVVQRLDAVLLRSWGKQGGVRVARQPHVLW